MNTYRADIDGLRALAVLSVIIFHLGYPWLPGGFVGVDIFFVISGYLITGILVTEVNATGKLDFGRFYMRRIRRLFPALLVTVAVSLVAGAMILPPEYMRSLGGSAAAALASVSNFFFWTQSGYFDVSNTMKPLLHTWSLSVEEQFYLVWPLLIAVSVRLTGARWGIVVAVVALASFGANLLFGHDQSAIFYLLPFRAFELAIGGLLVWIERMRSADGPLADASLLAGLGLLVWSFLNISESMVFPSYNALYPCLGAALVIWGGKHSRFRILLANPLCVGIGKISYSLYLVHWPLIVLGTYWGMVKLDDGMRLWLAAGMVASSLMMFFLVEQPFRRPKPGSVLAQSKLFLGGAVALGLIIALPAFNAWSSGGWDWRYSAETLKLMDESNLHLDISNPLNGCLKSKEQTRADIPASCYAPDPNDPRPTLLLLGDSTANHLVLGFLQVLGQDYQIKIWASSSCAPILGFSFSREGKCDENNREFYEHILHDYSYDLVIFSANNAASAFVEAFDESAALVEDAGADFVLVGQMPTFLDRPLYIAARFGSGDLERAMNEKVEVPCIGEHGLDALVKPSRFFSAKKALCQDDRILFQDEGRLLQADTLHLSDYGSIFVAHKFADWAKSNGHLSIK